MCRVRPLWLPNRLEHDWTRHLRERGTFERDLRDPEDFGMMR